jgi:glycosyltransferase involved in cell wall biosynthesis
MMEVQRYIDKYKMRILIVNDYGIELGGTETYLLNLIKELKERNHDVKVFSSDYSINGIHFEDYSFSHLPSAGYFRKILLLFNPISLIKLMFTLRSFKPDIVHLNNIWYQNSSSILLTLKRYPAIMTVHDLQIVCPCRLIPNNSNITTCKGIFDAKCKNCLGKDYFNQKIFYSLMRYLIKNITLLLTNSEYTLRCIKNLKKEIPIKHLKFGIKLLNYSELKNNKKILFVGRLTKGKGVEYLIKSLPLIIKKIPTASLIILGNGPEKKSLLNLSEDLKLSKKILFVDKVPHDLVQKYYNESSIVIVPSISVETLGLIGPEAMSVGRPVIATNVGGIPEWCIDGITGYLVPPGNSKAIAQKVIKLFSDNRLLKKMSKAARKKSEEYDIRNHVIELENIYVEIISKSNTRQHKK